MLRAKNILIGTLMICQLGCGTGSPKKSSLTTNPQPDISISPVSTIVGSPDLTLTVTAVGALTFFGDPHNKSQVVWSANGNDTVLTTTFVSPTELRAMIPAALLANPIIANVAVETGDPLGSAPLAKSGSVSFTVSRFTSGLPSISSVSPTSAAVGSPDVTLTLSGSGFASGFPFVVWSVDGIQNYLTPTSNGSDTQLIVVIPEALMTKAVTAEISVQIYEHPADSFPKAVSNYVSFNVSAP